VASNDSESIIDKRNVKYNISDHADDRTIEKQTRSEYRKENLRPNGTKYED